MGAGRAPGLLTVNAIQAAPAGLAAMASATALAVTTTSILTLTKGALFAMSITNAKTVAVVVGVAVIVTGTALWISHQNQPPPTSAPATPARSSAPAAVPNLPAPPPTKVTAPVAPQQLNRGTLAASLLDALRETDTAKRRARLRALLREVERGDLDWAYEVVAGIPPLKTTPIEDKTGNCRACHTSGLPTGNQMNCAVNARLNDAMQALMFRWGELDPQAALAKDAHFPVSVGDRVAIDLILRSGLYHGKMLLYGYTMGLDVEGGLWGGYGEYMCIAPGTNLMKTGGYRMYRVSFAGDTQYAAIESTSGAIRMNSPPNTSSGYASQTCVAANSKLTFVPFSVRGVTDPEGDPVTIKIAGISSDEVTATDKQSGGAKYALDAGISGNNNAIVRAERSSAGNGRVYTILFTASDNINGVSQGVVTVCVALKYTTTCTCIDSGQLYDATKIN